MYYKWFFMWINSDFCKMIGNRVKVIGFIIKIDCCI